MSRRAAITILGGLLLAGCASGSQPADRGWFMGNWIVTGAFPAGAVGDMDSAPRGQAVALEAARAGDVAGRLCLTPRYGETRTAPEGWPGMPAKVGTLQVDCGDLPFARYAVLPDGALMTRHGAWMLRLESAALLAAQPAPMAAEAPPPPMAVAPLAEPPPASAAAPPPPPPPASASPPAAPPAARKLVYLASYRTEESARKGWSGLAGHSAALKGSEAVMKSVDIKDKGRFVRLFAATRDDATASAICKDLVKAINECGIKGRE